MDVERLRQQMDFLVAVEKLKGVLRKTSVPGLERKENAAEHTWQVMLMAIVLAEHSSEPVDAWNVVQMLAIHEIGEIDCGDTFHYDKDYLAVGDGERTAVTRILGLLPQEQRGRFLALWNEFESGETADARFARAIDRIWPIIQNMQNGGGSWLEFGITHSNAVAKNREIAAGSETLWNYLQGILKDCNDRGYLARQ